MENSTRCKRDRDRVGEEGQGEVFANAPKGRTRQLDRVGECAETRRMHDHVRRVDRDVGSPGERNAYIGRGQCRGIVHAIARDEHNGGLTSERSPCAHCIDLARRRDFGGVFHDARTRGGLRDRSLMVPAQQGHLEAEIPKPLDRTCGIAARPIAQADEPERSFASSACSRDEGHALPAVHGLARRLFELGLQRDPVLRKERPRAHESS